MTDLLKAARAVLDCHEWRLCPSPGNDGYCKSPRCQDCRLYDLNSEVALEEFDKHGPAPYRVGLKRGQ